MRLPEVTRLDREADPVAAFWLAHREGRPVAVPSSGTTARPRTIVRTTDSWVASFAPVSRLCDLDPASRVWIPGPLSSTMNLFAAVQAHDAGASNVKSLRAATHAFITPWQLRQVLSHDPDGLAGTTVVTAGDRLDSVTHSRATALGARVHHYYGAAELSFVAWGDHTDALTAFPDVEIEARYGELWVRSPYLAEGYLESWCTLRSDAGWMTVGDRGDVTDERVVVRGRDGAITTGGATVLVADIEHALAGSATGEVVVVGVRHVDLGEVVVAVLTRAEDAAGLRDVSRQALAPAQRPRRWVYADDLPRTESGKIDRDRLLETVADLTVLT